MPNRKQGYNSDIDAVYIGYDGTEGEIIEIEGLRILLPKPPKDIWSRSTKKSEQYFERELMPDGLNEDTIDLYTEYLEKQIKYKKEGFWFMNNGKPEYIVGEHWFFLQWCKGDAEKSNIYPNGEYHYFTKGQQKLAYFMKASILDDRSYGVIFIKPRRLGATALGLAFELSTAITKKNGGFGITSYNEGEAKKAYLRLVNFFKNLPFFFKPRVSNISDKEGIIFNSPQERVTSKNNTVKSNTGLNTFIDYNATTVKAYDSRAITYYVCDESAKWDIVSIKEHWYIVRRTLTKGAIITGKAFLLSTLENYNGMEKYPDDDRAKSGDRFMYLYDNSNCKDRGATGRTTTGLYKIFLSCYDHFEGKMDIYGFPVVDTPEKPVRGAHDGYINVGIKEHIDAEILSITDQTTRYNELRKVPRSEQDLRRIVSNNTTFDTGKINSQIEYNNAFVIDELKRFNLSWENGIPDTNVIINYCDNGRFLASWIPPENMRNAKIGIDGNIYPKYEDVGVFGCDPYKVDKAAYGNGSKGSLHGFSKLNQVGAPQWGFFLEYIDRPQTRELFYEDVIMCLCLYSMPALIENNVNELLVTMYKRGYTKFALRNPFKIKLNPSEKLYGGISSNGEDIIKTHAGILQ